MDTNINNKLVHFIGIGGVSMSGIAEILLSRGIKVSGSDRGSSQITEKLKNLGATIFIGHDSNNIKDVDIVIYTSAIAKENPELSFAIANGITLFTRAEFLGLIMDEFKKSIAISGTHGKTTTTSMMSHVLLESKKDPTILVGGNLKAIGGNSRVGASEYFLTESCEYMANFLNFYPHINIILNIDLDHLDFYRDITHIKDTFLEYSKNTKDDGFLIGNADDEKVFEILKVCNKNSISFGIKNGDIIAEDIIFNPSGSTTFNCYDTRGGKTLISDFTIFVPGEHNVLNSLSVIASSICLGISINDIKQGLANFKGVAKRFEYKGSKNGITVIDDYAHHPTEIKTSILSAKNLPHNRIICVFQPHTYSRTKALLDEFSLCFSGADEVILADIYAAREVLDESITSKMLSDKISENGISSVYIDNLDDISKYLEKTANSGDVILTIGAGDIAIVGEQFLK